MSKKWVIPVVWSEAGKVSVEADTIEEAVDIVKNDGNVEWLSRDGYVDSSFEVSVDDVEYIRAMYNGGQEDEVENG